MSFVLAGFTQRVGFRVFQFDSVEHGRPRVRYTVEADLALARKHGVHMQDLPLLCRRLLDQHQEDEIPSSFTLTEAEMIACAEKESRDHAARKRKPSAQSPDAGARPV